jgi:hypothetical protein
MGILTYETFLLDVLFKKKLRTRKDDLKFPRGHMNFHRGHWPRGNSIIIDLLGEYEAICETALGLESGP